jgi:hypothetical protein
VLIWSFHGGRLDSAYFDEESAFEAESRVIVIRNKDVPHSGA